MERIALVMAGGSGERFWPLSRRTQPKQLLRLLDPNRTLLQMAIERIAPLVGENNVFIATSPQLVEPVLEATPGFPKARVLAEPCKRNTAGCLIWHAAHWLAQHGEEDAVVAVLSADHWVEDVEAFQQDIVTALDHAERTSDIVVLGVEPSRPETGYGYIEVEWSGQPGELGPVKAFREKPTLESAEKFVASGRFLWNSGTFFWRMKTFLDVLERAQPEMFQRAVEISVALRAGQAEDAARLFETLPNISIDFAVIESAPSLAVVKTASGWDDAGSWEAVQRICPQSGGSGSFSIGDVVAVETAESVLVNRSPALLATLGVEGLAIVATEDAILVCPLDRSQELRKMVDELRARNKEHLL